MSQSQSAITLTLSPRIFKFVSFLFFYLTWALCILGQSKFMAVSGLIIVMHFLLSPSKNADAIAVLMLSGIGITTDMLLTFYGVFVFENVFFPFWLAILWVVFSLTFNHSLSWLLRLPILWQILIGAAGGASSYISAYFLGAVGFTYSLLVTGIIVAVVWGLLVPFFCYLIRNYVH